MSDREPPKELWRVKAMEGANDKKWTRIYFCRTQEQAETRAWVIRDCGGEVLSVAKYMLTEADHLHNQELQT